MLDGSAGPDVDLDEPPKRGDVIETETVVMIAYEVLEGADGSLVINASRAGEVLPGWTE